MTKLEEELYRMFGHSGVLTNAKFVGNACYGRLTDQIRVKISFHTQEPREEERIRQKEGMDARQTGPVMG